MSHVAAHGDRQPAGLLAAGRRRSPPRAPGLPAGRRAGRGRRLRHLVVHGAWRTRRCARRAGHGETDAFQASEFPAGRRVRPGRRDHPLRHHHRGRSTCSRAARRPHHRAVDHRRRRGTARCSLASDAIVLDFADERSVVQTRFATSALALLRAHLGEDLGPRRGRRRARRRLRRCRWTRPTIEQITFLGRGWTVGLAQEAALKCREAATFWAEAYPAMDYRHGPISHRRARPAVWAFGDVAAPGWRDGRRARPAATFGRPCRARPDGRPDPGAALRGGARRAPRARPGRAAPPDPVGGPGPV